MGTAEDEAGGLNAAFSDGEFFKRWRKFIDKRLANSGKKNTPQGFYKSLSSTRAYQIVDQELLDMLHAAEEAAKKSR